MDLRWTDVLDIAIELDELYPESDPLSINFLELHNKVIELEGFSDDPSRGGEKVLEAIQMAWIEERE
ncbi:MAG: Fe-S cluster assembly protein IscX [Gammaproteobacteria bacterium]|jgi:FeS assembly protein IscX|nr:Fe-S cluster assembly protein IscX [Gammaproteobacteria bacterium]MBT4607044.1 Fe-S cluster assembly protein IscX [Thiotrichales bacterium]MBT3473250.1 Fe-S cluster assembly protein IscX [Gammaproteobacteria bacterium]MBT3966651.1 Fe-S cluster assembly protein IscX [Gammaproteobacteria bacterium]MBT4081678.1 Fe-S cluster assembly protein IscX [Gammaproteobacteria bacterium]